MVTIRLTRRGGKNAPFYHVVVTDSRRRQGGRMLEQVGYFNPIARGKDRKLELNLPRIEGVSFAAVEAGVERLGQRHIVEPRIKVHRRRIIAARHRPDGVAIQLDECVEIIRDHRHLYPCHAGATH